MPVHSVFVLNAQGKVLFVRHYDPACLASAEERAQWERVIYRNIRHHLKAPQAAAAGGGASASSASVSGPPVAAAAAAVKEPQFFVEGEVFAVYRGVNDLLVLLAGTDECDELLLTELLPVVTDLLHLACDKRKGAAGGAASEALLLQPPGEAFGKFACMVDEMVPPGGLVEHAEVEVIERLAKAKPLA